MAGRRRGVRLLDRGECYGVYLELQEFVATRIRNDDNPNLDVAPWDERDHVGPTHILVDLVGVNTMDSGRRRALEEWRPGTSVHDERHPITLGVKYTVQIPREVEIRHARGGGGGVDNYVSRGSSVTKRPSNEQFMMLLLALVICVAVLVFKVNNGTAPAFLWPSTYSGGGGG